MSRGAAGRRDEDLQDLEDAARRRLVALYERLLGYLALAGGAVGAGALWAFEVESAEAYAVAGGVALVGLAVVLFGRQVVERLRLRKRRG